MVEGDGDLIDEMWCLEWLNKIMKECWDEWILMEAADDICVSGKELWLGTLRNWVVCYFCVEIYLMELRRMKFVSLCLCLMCSWEFIWTWRSWGGGWSCSSRWRTTPRRSWSPSLSGESCPKSFRWIAHLLTWTIECNLIPFVAIQF